MRSPRRKRPLQRAFTQQHWSGADLQAMAERVRYVGSVEHKDTRSFAGNPPRPRPDASICDQSLARRQDEVTAWLRQGILNGHFGSLFEGEFPRYVWYRDGDTVYEGRLVNRELGEYKGYPLNIDEWPEGIEGGNDR